MTPPPPLVRILAVRMLAASAAVAIGLLLFFTAQYLAASEDLARKALADEGKAIAEAVSAGKDPAGWFRYVHYPGSYGFRVFEKHLPPGQRKLREANVGLLPPLPPPASAQDDPILHLQESFGPLPAELRGTTPMAG